MAIIQRLMDFNYIEKRILKSEWRPEIDENCDVFYNVDAEKELTAILTEQINRQIRNAMIDLVNDCERNGVCCTKLTKKQAKKKPKPKQKEYFGDMRMENGSNDFEACIDGKRYNVHKSCDVPGKPVMAKWELPDHVDCVGNFGGFKSAKTKYAKTEIINDTFTGKTCGDILTTCDGI